MLTPVMTHAHTMYDTTPPSVVTFDPLNAAELKCRSSTPPYAIDNSKSPPCLQIITLTFDEDVFRGTGNITVQCEPPLVSLCSDELIPIDQEYTQMGSTIFENRKLHLKLESSLYPTVVYRLIFAEGTVLDRSGNKFGMSHTCPYGYDPKWQSGVLSQCPATYRFESPS